MRIGINGFGRIGRNFAMAPDSNYGAYPGTVTSSGEGITIDGRDLRVLAERDPGRLPWRLADLAMTVGSKLPAPAGR
jgi:glyceraldehyde-3-phosphate dehydrogenase/erythrose-4-phosphate dehydrogenase